MGLTSVSHHDSHDESLMTHITLLKVSLTVFVCKLTVVCLCLAHCLHMCVSVWLCVCRYIGVVASFLSLQPGGLQRETLALDAKPLAVVSETAAANADCLVSVLAAANIPAAHTVAIMSDGASNAQAAYNALHERPEFQHLTKLPPCAAHAAALAAKSIATIPEVQEAVGIAKRVHSAFARASRLRASAAMAAKVHEEAESNPAVRQVLNDALSELRRVAIADKRAVTAEDEGVEVSDEDLYIALDELVGKVVTDPVMSTAPISDLPMNQRWSIPGYSKTRFASLHSLFAGIAKVHSSITTMARSMPELKSLPMDALDRCTDLIPVLSVFKRLCADVSAEDVTLGRLVVIVKDALDELGVLETRAVSSVAIAAAQQGAAALLDRFPFINNPEEHPLHLVAMLLDPFTWRTVRSRQTHHFHPLWW